MSDQVDDLEQLIQSLEVTGAHIIGHSYGAYLALMVAIKSPTMIGRKSLVSKILNERDRQLTRRHIDALSQRFKISPALFFSA